MRLDLVEELLESNNPIDLMWEELKNIYLEEDKDDIRKYYSQTEKKVKNLERFLLKAYFELYQEVLVKRAKQGELELFEELDDNDDETYLLMDALSLREMGLLFNKLKAEGYRVELDYGLAALPSDTQFYRKKIRLDIIKRTIKYRRVNDYNNINIFGDERFIWSSYPDTLVEEVRSGQTLKNDLTEVYKKTEGVVFEVLNKTNKSKVIIGSDHGYIRTEAAYNIDLKNKTVKKWLRKLFGGSRFVAKEEAEQKLAEKLLERNLIVEVNNEEGSYYLPISHYSWPVSGKYSTFSHGGLSLLEVITPRIIVVK